MRDIRVAATQFEHRDGDRDHNLGRVAALTSRAAVEGAALVAFHECCVTGYTFQQHLDHDGFRDLAEPVPDGPSVRALQEIAGDHRVVVGAGLVEADPSGTFHNTYVVVDGTRVLARHRKLHTFLSPFHTPGDAYTIFEHAGVSFGVLTCYDNNLPENVRATALLGAEVVLMPHVTGCLPSPMPGRGTVDRPLWENRHRDPVRLRQEFQGPKGKGWLIKWLPARAWENGIYAVFSNPIGVDADTIKPGLAMILDPDGEILVESASLGDDIVVGLLTAETYERASGRRYLRARRPELYATLVEPHPQGTVPLTLPGWRRAFDPPDDRSGRS